MCQGKTEPLYRPMTADMLPHTRGMFPHIPHDTVEDIYRVMTRHFHMPTLAGVCLLTMIDRFENGARDEPSFELGAGMRFSALHKDLSGRMQTAEMRLAHEVMTTLPMAMTNIERLQALLSRNFGARFVAFHSCGQAIVAQKDEATFYERSAHQQLVRTGLDATTITRVGTVPDVLAKCFYSKDEVAILERCVTRAHRLVEFAPAFQFNPQDVMAAAA